MLVNIIQNTISSFRSALAAAEVITTNLKMWLGFETSSIDGDKQITPDKSGNNNVGELFTGKALYFDGAGDYVEVPNSTSLNVGTNDFTYCFWVYIGSAKTQRIIDKRSDTRGFNFYLDSSNVLKLELKDGTGFAVFTLGTLTSSVWQRVIISADRDGNAICYINGVAQTPVDISSKSGDLTDTTSLFIGADAPSASTFYFDGFITDIQWYDTILSQEDVTYDYANPQNLVTDRDGTSIALSNLKAYWAMSEGAGSFAYNSAVALGADVVTDGDFPLPNVNWTIGQGTEIIVSGARVNNTVTGGIAFVKQFLNNSPFGKTFLLTYDVVATNGNLLALQQATDLDLDTSTTGTNKKYIFTWNRTTAELTIKRKGGQTGGTDVTIDNISLQEISAGVINGATYEPAQPRIPQLGMQNWSKPTIGSDVVTLIPNPNNTSQDIFGNAVRDRLNSFNLDGTGYCKVDDSTSLGITNGTLQFWLKTSDTNFTILEGTVSKEYIGRTNNGNWTNGGTATITTFIDNAVSSSQPLYDNNWHFYTFTGININLWTEFSIGTETLDGLISDVLIYDGVLTSSQIKNNYKAGLSAHTND